jgi:hypothetical protein
MGVNLLVEHIHTQSASLVEVRPAIDPSHFFPTGQDFAIPTLPSPIILIPTERVLLDFLIFISRVMLVEFDGTVTMSMAELVLVELATETPLVFRSLEFLCHVEKE